MTRQKSNTTVRFEQFLAGEYLAETRSGVEVINYNQVGNSKGISENSIGGTASARSSLPLIERNLTG